MPVTVDVTRPLYAGGRRRGMAGPGTVAALMVLVAVAVAACGRPTSTPGLAPTSAPTASNPTSAAARPTAQAAPDPTQASPADLENAFLSNVDDLIAEAADLTVTPCPDLTTVTHDNPNLVPSMRGFVAAVKRVGAAQAVLNTDAVKTSLADLDHSMSDLEGALSVCGIKQP